MAYDESDRSSSGSVSTIPARCDSPASSSAVLSHASRGRNPEGYGRRPPGRGGGRRSAAHRCRSCRSPTRRSQRRCDVADTCTDWMGPRSSPNAAKKSGWRATSLGSGVSACRRNENSPSWRLTSTSAPRRVAVTRRSHVSSRTCGEGRGAVVSPCMREETEQSLIWVTSRTVARAPGA